MTAEANAGLTKMLTEVLGEIRSLVGQRRVTVVFDRGGWSPKLFQTILEQDFDILTYRKGKGRRMHEKRFVRRRATLDGRWVSYHLHDQPVRFLKGKLRLRQVTRLIGPHYARLEHKGRTLLHELFHASADLHLSESELRVTLCSLSSPHRTLAVEALCEHLNETATTFPGSRLRLHFDVHPPPVRGLAFPGSRAAKQGYSPH